MDGNHLPDHSQILDSSLWEAISQGGIHPDDANTLDSDIRLDVVHLSQSGNLLLAMSSSAHHKRFLWSYMSRDLFSKDHVSFRGRDAPECVWTWRIVAEKLLDNSLQVGQVRDAAHVDLALFGEFRAQLLHDLLLYMRQSCKNIHQPCQRTRGRFGSGRGEKLGVFENLLIGHALYPHHTISSQFYEVTIMVTSYQGSFVSGHHVQKIEPR